ncbi:MAG: hypothetical protein KBC26_02870 [Candidatus Pacebacteria bacterium]|nr:hypothetical protein [Candidatus Paceibacterota bacterium]
MLKQLLDELVPRALAGRQKEVIVQRFGIGGGKPKTLALLGKRYGVTRERVRQIEVAALKVLEKHAQDNDRLLGIYKKSIDHLESVGGVRRADFLINDLKFVLRDQALSEPYVELLFGIFRSPEFFLDNKEFHGFWYLKPDHVKELKRFIAKVAQILKTKKEAVIERKKFDELFAQAARQHKMSDFIALNFLLNSKLFAVSPFGDTGLVSWPEIKPKTVRDKSYLILKKRRSPLHFRDIAQEINKVRFDSKKAHPQTVHNELIKDKRFVLVGRGLYSLKEFGIEEGTAREIIHKLLKKNGPSHVDRVVQLVSQQRVLKHNTIVLNLQNKKYFKRLSDGRYYIA